MKNVLVVADTDWWVFDKIYRGIRDNLQDWKVDVHYTRKNGNINHEKYSIVLFLCDYQVHLIAKNNIPRDKLVLAIRSNVQYPFYSNSENVKNVAKIIAVSNQKLYDRFVGIHPNVILAPGGVDADKFYFSTHNIKQPVRVGWSGSAKNFGEAYRGLPIIRIACQKLGFVFNPALREKRMRTEDEMVDYYHNEIDIYVDMSSAAGRQNGLLEAGACGLPIISTNVGIADKLIRNGENGIICDRNATALMNALKQIIPIASKCGKNIREDIEKEWSWKPQAHIFRGIFNQMIFKSTDIELNDIPSSEWEIEYKGLLKDSYIKKKYNRQRRLQEKRKYINEHLPIIKKCGGNVLDIGPGPGEFLEICRFYGNKTFGVDCIKPDFNMMGSKYHRLSQLMVERQWINVKYEGFENYIKNGRLPFDDCSLSVINSQGSIEQVFKNYMKHENKNNEGWAPSHNGLWNINKKLIMLFDLFFREMERVLVVNGVILIYGNGSGNYQEYHKMVIDSINKNGSLKLIKTDNRRYHKIVKVGG